jgi:hypothetical protein
MDVVRQIAGWCCVGGLGIFGLWGLLVAAMMFLDNLWRRRRRREFREHEAYRRTPEGGMQIVSPELERRLEQIGEFTLSPPSGEREIRWANPHGLHAFRPCELAFVIEPDNIGPDERTFALWESFKARQAEHFPELQQRLVDLHREVRPDLEPGTVPSLVPWMQILIRQEGYGERGTHTLEAHFEMEWDEEHAYWLTYDSATGHFGEWEN